MKLTLPSFSLAKAFSLVALMSCTALLGIACVPAGAAPVPYPIVVTDTSGNRVTGATATVNGTALVNGTATTVTGKLLATGATVSAPVTQIELSNGAYVEIYDAAASGEAYFPIVFTKSGSTIAPIYDLVASADSSNIQSAQSSAASSATQGTANGTAIGSVNTKLGTPAGASVSADIASANTSLGTITGNFTTMLARIPQVVLFDASGYIKANSYVLPATVPSGYGGTSGGAPVVHR